MTTIKITWSGRGGELDSVVVDAGDDDNKITRALIDMVQGQIVSDGDSFTVREL
jgi:hypothetical protein